MRYERSPVVWNTHLALSIQLEQYKHRKWPVHDETKSAPTIGSARSVASRTWARRLGRPVAFFGVGTLWKANSDNVNGG